jgi:hypothetical protein
LRTLHEGTDSKGVCDAKKIVVSCLYKLGKYLEAIPLQRDILDWHERNHNCDAQSTVDHRYSMADIQLFARHYTNALDGLLRVVSWRKVTYGKDHIKTLMVVQRVGMAHTCLGRLGEALPYLVEAADGYMTLEPHSASTVTALEIVAETAKKN